MFSKSLYSVGVLGAALSLAIIASQSTVAESVCEMDNRALRTMSHGVVTIVSPPGRKLEVPVKIANNNYTRAAGFQSVCAERIAETPILFTFEFAVRPSFHMNNVVAPIDIAFITEEGSIDSIHAMQPYGADGKKPRYAANGPIVAALEVRPGFYTDHGVGADSLISWTERRTAP